MNTKELAKGALSDLGPVRVSPVQARSTKRVANLLDSTANYIQQFGYETLTTAVVAERGGASIGTVYRYFPDRIALLQTLIGRHLQRAEAAVVQAVAGSKPLGAQGALEAVFDALVEMFRSEPGYRSIRVGDPLDIRPITSERLGNQRLAQLVIDALSDSFGVVLDSRGRLAIETSLEVADSLLTKAFLRSERGDKALIDEAKRVFQLVVSGVL